MANRLIVSVVFLFYRRPTQAQYFDREPYEGEAESVDCPPGWVYDIYGNHCIHVPLKRAQGPVDWENAELYCKSVRDDLEHAPRLVSISNHKTLAAILDIFKNQWNNASFWLGEITIEADGLWQSEDKKEFEQGNFTTPVRNCRAYGEGKWILKDCNSPAVPVCELIDVDPCQNKSAGCQHFCYNNGFRKNICACRPGYILNGRQCEALHRCDVNNGDCSHICKMREDLRICCCQRGYKPVEHVKCQDINECEMNNGGCEGRCINTPGSWECFCPDIEKDEEGRFCRHNAHLHGKQPETALSRPMITVSIILTVLIVSIGTYAVLVEQYKLKRTGGEHDIFSSRQTEDSKNQETKDIQKKQSSNNTSSRTSSCISVGGKEHPKTQRQSEFGSESS